MSAAPQAPATPQSPTDDAMLLDLELQWKDHHHMRDQTWKVLASNVVLLGGVIALAAQKPHPIVLTAAYTIVITAAVLGWAISTHHRRRQKQKFAIIEIYETRLGLYELKKSHITGPAADGGIAGKVFTSNFIGLVQLGVGVFALVLLIMHLGTGA